jgi:ubiquinone/menaquinone biosynthesis C-methylase UbiE
MKNESFISNGYEKYWKNTVEKKRNGDYKPPEDEIIKHYIEMLDIKPNNKVLDVGTGYGRNIPLLNQKRCQVYAIDILESMVEEAKTLYGTIATEIKVSKAEEMDYENNFFDIVFCWAVFDCLEQEKALKEMIRVLNTSGKMVLTGKNIEYMNDDEVAYIAEVKALEKNFPNHFTDIGKLINQLDLYGLKAVELRGFKYRGDFAFNKFEDLTKYKDNFYEFLIVLQKYEDVNIDVNNKFCRNVSNNYVRQNK